MACMPGLPPHPIGRAQSWKDVDADIRAYVERTVRTFTDELGDRLAGVVLHGSLAAGCFYRAKSDLDLLVVVKDGLSVEARERIALALARQADTRPILGDLELSVLRAADATDFRHPSPFELHYSQTWRERMLAGNVDYAADRTDSDLAGHVTVARARGVSLYGPEPCALFGEVSASAFLESVRDDVVWSLSGDHLLESPYYGVLNACRALRAHVEGVEEAMRRAYSKEEGGAWALTYLPERHRRIVEQALACYRSDRPVSEAERLTDGHAWDVEALRAFRDHVAAVLL